MNCCCYISNSAKSDGDREKTRQRKLLNPQLSLHHTQDTISSQRICLRNDHFGRLIQQNVRRSIVSDDQSSNSASCGCRWPTLVHDCNQLNSRAVDHQLHSSLSILQHHDVARLCLTPTTDPWWLVALPNLQQADLHLQFDHSRTIVSHWAPSHAAGSKFSSRRKQFRWPEQKDETELWLLFQK